MTSLVLFWSRTVAVWRLWPWAALKVIGLEFSAFGLGIDLMIGGLINVTDICRPERHK